MQAWITNLLEYTVAMSVLSLIYITAMPLLSRRYTAKWLYYTWLVIVTGWVFPFRPQFDVNLLPAEMPVLQKITMIQTIPVEYINTANPLLAVANETSTSSLISFLWIITSIWITGAVITILANTSRHWRFMKLVNRWGENVTDSQTLSLLNDFRTELGISTKVGIKTCSGITNPMMAGFFQPVIYLPSDDIPIDELAFILRHELVHIKRKDLWYKAFVLLASAIHWFNPVVYIMAKVIAVQCEISCDELVLQGTSIEKRRQYGETIIAFVRNETKLQTVLSTSFYGGKSDMKTRIFSIMDTSKKRAGTIVLSTVILATITSGMVFATDLTKNDHSAIVSVDKQTEIPTEELVEIKVLDDPEITEPELTETELTEPELSSPELTEPELTRPELTESERTEPELAEPEQVVIYYKDDIEIISVVNDGTEYIDIDWLSSYLASKYNSDYSIQVIGDKSDTIKTQLIRSKTQIVLYDNIPTFSFLLNNEKRNCVKYDFYMNKLTPLMTD